MSTASPHGPYAHDPYAHDPHTHGRPAPEPSPWARPAAQDRAAPPAYAAVGPTTPMPPVAPTAAPATVRRAGWLPLAGTATAAAVLASLATAGLTGALTGLPGADGTTDVATPGQGDTQVVVPVTSSTSEQPDWPSVAAAVRDSVVAIDVRTASGGGTGSGVIIDADGLVLTNDHVVGDAVDGGLLVTLADGRVLEATIVGLDPTTDLAVIRLTDPPSDLRAAVLGDSEAVGIGDPVMAVGNPLGLDSTVTTGIVSALDRPVSTSDGGSTVVTNAIQIDASVNPGNSGGPLFDVTGQVIGITSSIASLPTGTGSSVGSIGLGFAIPANLAERVAAELAADGTAEHAFLGVSLSDGTGTADGTTRRGAVVEAVTEGSPAGAAGVRTGDVVVAIDGEPVSGAESLTGFVREHAAGEAVTVTVVRDGRALDLEVTLAVREEQPATEGSGSEGSPVPERSSDPGALPFPWAWPDRG